MPPSRNALSNAHDCRSRAMGRLSPGAFEPRSSRAHSTIGGNDRTGYERSVGRGHPDDGARHLLRGRCASHGHPTGKEIGVTSCHAIEHRGERRSRSNYVDADALLGELSSGESPNTVAETAKDAAALALQVMASCLMGGSAVWGENRTSSSNTLAPAALPISNRSLR